MRHLKFRKKRKRAPHKAKLHFLSEKIHWNQKSGCALDRRDCSRLCTCIYTGILFWTASEQCRRFDAAGIKKRRCCSGEPSGV